MLLMKQFFSLFRILIAFAPFPKALILFSNNVNAMSLPWNAAGNAILGHQDGGTMPPLTLPNLSCALLARLMAFCQPLKVD